MRARDAKVKRELVQAAQRVLDNEVGLKVLGRFMDREITPMMVQMVRRMAEQELWEVAPRFAGYQVLVLWDATRPRRLELKASNPSR